MSGSGHQHFYCDAMLGRLARELRLLGFDVRYDRQKGGLVAYKEARAENRIFLTRNSRTRALPGSFFVESQTPAEQVNQVRERLGLGAAPVRAGADVPGATPAAGAPGASVHSGRPPVAAPSPGGRCLECNEALQRIGRDQARPAIPFYIFQIHHEFQRCPKCGRVYWPGSHVQNMVARLSAADSRKPEPETGPGEPGPAGTTEPRAAPKPDRQPRRRFFRRGPRRPRTRQGGQA